MRERDGDDELGHELGDDGIFGLLGIHKDQCIVPVHDYDCGAVAPDSEEGSVYDIR